MKVYRIKEIAGYVFSIESGYSDDIIERYVQVKTLYGWTTVKKFGYGDFEALRAKELLDLLNETI